MKKRLVIYFHYDKNGRADDACLFMLRAIAAEAARVLFVTNGALTPESAAAVAGAGAELRERENVGLDAGAYKETLLALGQTGLAEYDELVMMNYTLAGPVSPLRTMFDAMDVRQELDFWGITRHYAMKSSRFKTGYGGVPEHIQSHFIAVRATLFNKPEFWTYWQELPPPKSYEQSVALHEARFTRWFADKGFQWDTYLNTDDLKNVFVNPVMACPAELIEHRGCPVFKRRSLFTPYADELRRTAGEAAGALYRCLTARSYPVDGLVHSLLPGQPLTALAKNLHWELTLSPCGEAGDTPAVVLLQTGTARELAGLVSSRPGQLLCLIKPRQGGVPDAAAWYADRAAESLYKNEGLLRAAARAFAQDPLLGLVSPAMPPFAPLYEERLACWRQALPALRKAMERYSIALPLEDSEPLPVPFADCVLVRLDALGGVLPPLDTPEGWWLLPLLAQKNGWISKTVCTPEQAQANGAVLSTLLYENQKPRAAAKNLGRAVKHTLKRRLGR